MTNPANTTFFTNAPADPRDRVDYVVDCITKNLLEPGESIASYTLTPRAEATALGLMISTSPYAPSQPTSTTIKFWVEFDPTYQSNALFDGAGQQLGIEVEVVTSNTPPRRRQRTVGITVAQQ